jgi:GT2 family glycosyltransferase
MTLRASVVISTYNRASALPATLSALGRQDIPADAYEVIVVDDGSTDDTSQVLSAIETPYRLRRFRQPQNTGVSAGRNAALRAAQGDWVIMISDDLIVPANFISVHLATHERFPDSWVVGGFTQLEELTGTPFGRYLDGLEQRFELARGGPELAPDIYEMRWPTARNLSLPRSDLERVGLFDEQFRVTCEDQDLAERARGFGIRFIYNAALACVHHDQAADLRRYCRFQERGAIDTVRLCRKYPQLHGGAEVVRVNGYISRRDPPALILAKLVKRLLSVPALTRALEALVAAAERLRLPERLLRRGYRMVIGVHIFRGFRTGLRDEREEPAR